MKCKADELLINRRRHKKSFALKRSIACLTSNITIVCVVIGYIIGGGFLFRYLEADAEYHRLKSGSDKVNRYKERFLSENKRQIQTFKSRLLTQTREYFAKLKTEVEQIDLTKKNVPMGRSRQLDPGKVEIKKVEKLISIVKNMSFLQEEPFSGPAVRTFNRTNSFVTDKFIEDIYNVSVDGFIIDFDENNTTLWSLPGSILYSVTVITTIGYGNIVPKTMGGKIGTIIYAMFGIPLMVLCLANLGSVVAVLFKILYNCTVKRCRKRKSRPRNLASAQKEKTSNARCSLSLPESACAEKDLSFLTSHSTKITKITESTQKDDQRLNVQLSIDTIDLIDNLQRGPDDNDFPLTFALIVFVVYLLLGATIIRYNENWDYMNSVYFVFITFSTIGFGDLVPGSLNYQWSNQVTPIICALYLLLGLILMSMCFQLIQDLFRQRATKMGQHIGLLNTKQNV